MLLSVKNLETYYFTSNGTVKAVDHVDLEIHENEVVGLVGESGCGKSTLGLSIPKLVPFPGKIVGGQILFKGIDILKSSEKEMERIRGRYIGVIFQDPKSFLNPVISIGKQITEKFLLHQKIKREEAEKQAIWMLTNVGISDVEDVMKRYPFQLSGGMKQRIIIAISLSCNPSLIIADEPTSALDVTIQRQIMDLIAAIRKKFNVSLLLITHDLGIVAEYCDRIYVMYAGKIVECADVMTIFEDPYHPYTVGLLNSILSIETYKKELHVIEGDVPNLVALPNGCSFNPRCSKKMNICKEKQPLLKELNKGHKVACWLY